MTPTAPPNGDHTAEETIAQAQTNEQETQTETTPPKDAAPKVRDFSVLYFDLNIAGHQQQAVAIVKEIQEAEAFLAQRREALVQKQGMLALLTEQRALAAQREQEGKQE